MSEIIYDYQADEVRIDAIILNGKEGAIQVFKDEEALEEDDNFITFQSADAAFDFIDALNEALVEAGHIRGQR